MAMLVLYKLDRECVWLSWNASSGWLAFPYGRCTRLHLLSWPHWCGNGCPSLLTLGLAQQVDVGMRRLTSSPQLLLTLLCNWMPWPPLPGCLLQLHRKGWSISSDRTQCLLWEGSVFLCWYGWSRIKANASIALMVLISWENYFRLTVYAKELFSLNS